MTDDEMPQSPDGAGPSYEVGYGKPPKHSQFKKGNKFGKGRPRGSRNMKTYVLNAFGAKVSAKINGKIRKLTKIELVLTQLANKAMSGDLKAIDQSVVLFERFGPVPDDDLIPEEETAYSVETLRHHLMMRSADDDE